MKEVWKDIPEFEGYYQVSNLGRVRSLNRIIRDGRNKFKGSIMKLTLDKKGYLRVRFSKNNIKTSFKVHRLVARAFIPNSDNKPEVNHKDLNKANNHIYNLEWISTKENSRHYFKSELAKGRNLHENNPKAKLTWDDINLIRKLKEEYSFTDYRLSWLFNVRKSHINKIINYKQWIMEV